VPRRSKNLHLNFSDNYSVNTTAEKKKGSCEKKSTVEMTSTVESVKSKIK
jgi:hypothetical protein